MSITFMEIPATQVFRGFIGIEGVTVEVQFNAPVNATVAEKDAAFIAALAQKVEIEYLPEQELPATQAKGEGQISEHDYADKGIAVCPVCGEADPQGESFDTAEGKVEQEMICPRCESKWTAIYQLAGYTQLELGESHV